MDKLTATTMLANDPSLVLVFVPIPDADDPPKYPFAFCNKCVVHGPPAEFYRELWVNACWWSVVNGRLSAYAVPPAEAVELADQDLCNICGDLLE